MTTWPNRPNFVQVPVDHPPDPMPNQLCRVGTSVGIMAHDSLYEFIRRNPTVNKPYDPVQLKEIYGHGEKPVSFQPATWEARVRNQSKQEAQPGQVVYYYDQSVGPEGQRSNCAVGEKQAQHDAIAGILLETIPAQSTQPVSILMQYARRDWHWLACPAVERDPDVCGGSWVFKGTRMPVGELFLHLSNGDSIEDFLKDFPVVTRQQVREVLQHEALDLNKYDGAPRVGLTKVDEREQAA